MLGAHRPQLVLQPLGLGVLPIATAAVAASAAAGAAPTVLLAVVPASAVGAPLAPLPFAVTARSALVSVATRSALVSVTTRSALVTVAVLATGPTLVAVAAVPAAEGTPSLLAGAAPLVRSPGVTALIATSFAPRPAGRPAGTVASLAGAAIRGLVPLGSIVHGCLPEDTLLSCSSLEMERGPHSDTNSGIHCTTLLGWCSAVSYSP
ncbi:hypothetical protein D1J51_17005, partial [Leucobacter sp. wl10]